MKRYTDSHEWIDEEGRVGISDFAANELGEIVHMDLPAIGTHLKAGQEAAVLETTKSACDLYAPASGEVIATNPSGKEWLYQIKIKDPSELDQLLDEEAYLKMVN